MQLQKDDTTKPIPFLLVDDVDKTTGVTGASPTVTVRKPGGSFVAAGGSVSEDDEGHYDYTPSSSEVDTAGTLKLHIEASGAEPVDLSVPIIDNAVWGTYKADNRDGSKIATDASQLKKGTQYRWTNSDGDSKDVTFDDVP